MYCVLCVCVCVYTIKTTRLFYLHRRRRRRCRYRVFSIVWMQVIVCVQWCFRYSIKINIWPLKSMETMQKLYESQWEYVLWKSAQTQHSLTPIPSTHLQNHFVQHSLKFQSSFSIELNHIIDDFWLWCVGLAECRKTIILVQCSIWKFVSMW